MCMKYTDTQKTSRRKTIFTNKYKTIISINRIEERHWQANHTHNHNTKQLTLAFRISKLVTLVAIRQKGILKHRVLNL